MPRLVVDELYRFRMLVAGIVVALGVSTTYGFSLFTEHMKAKYGFTQADITTISTVGNVMANCAFVFGIMFDFVGPKVQLLTAGTLASLGLLLFAMCFEDVIYSPSRETMVAYFSVFSGIMFLGCPSLDGGAILPLMMTFPLDRGYMVIIQKTFSGLGTSVLMIYFNAWFRKGDAHYSKQYSSYSFFLAAQVLVCAMVGAYFIDVPAYSPCEWRRRKMTPAELLRAQQTLPLYLRQSPPRRRLYLGCGIVLCLLIFLIVVITYGAFEYISPLAFRIIWGAVMLHIFCFILLTLPIRLLGEFPRVRRHSALYKGLAEMDSEEDEDVGKAPTEHPLPTSGDEADEPLSSSAEAVDPFEEEVMDRLDGDPESSEREEKVVPLLTASGEPQYQGSFWSHLLSLDLWLLWLSFFGMWGTGIVLIFNAAQIYRSINRGHVDSQHVALYVGLIGIGSAIGRFSSGVLDMVVTRRRQAAMRTGGPAALSKVIHSTLFFPFGAVLLALCFLLLLCIPPEGIGLPFVVGAMGNGIGWGLGVLTVRLLYAQDIGKHYNFMWTSGMVATIALNRFMFGNLFDAEANRAGTSPYCNSAACVRKQMWILLGVNVASALSATAVHVRFTRYVRRALMEGVELQGAIPSPSSSPSEPNPSNGA